MVVSAVMANGSAVADTTVADYNSNQIWDSNVAVPQRGIPICAAGAGNEAVKSST